MEFIMTIFDTIINKPFGYLMEFLYNISGGHYLIALFLFTLVTRIILLPFSIKQHKNSLESLRFRPKIQKIQQKYATNKQKQQQEMMKLYEKEGYNPAGGCGTLILQLPIISGLYAAIRQPLTYMFHMSNETLVKINAQLGGVIKATGKLTVENAIKQNELQLADAITNNMDKIHDLVPNAFQPIDFSFLGLNLSQTPHWAFPLILIPILAGVSSIIFSLFSQKYSPMAENGGMKGQTIIMGLIMAGMSLFFCNSFPAGIGVYWIYGNLISMLQQFLLYKIMSPEKYVAKYEQAEQELKRRRKENMKQIYSDKGKNNSSDETASDNSGVIKLDANDAVEVKPKTPKIDEAHKQSYKKNKKKKK